MSLGRCGATERHSSALRTNHPDGERHVQSVDIHDLVASLQRIQWYITRESIQSPSNLSKRIIEKQKKHTTAGIRQWSPT